MALVFKDRVKETTTTTGTGTVNLDGAEIGFQSFVAAIGTTNTCHYAITDGTSWEVGLGTVTDAAPDTLSRDTVYDSSNAGSLVNFAAGTKDVFCSASAYNATNPTVTGNLTVEGTFTSNSTAGINGTTTIDLGFLEVQGAGSLAGRFGSSDYIAGGTDNNLIIQAGTGKQIIVFSGGTENARIDGSGNIGVGRTPVKVLDVSGDIRTSTGILFGTDTAAANTLDDYEEGTWTPVLSDGTNNATMNTQVGSYDKVGRKVSFKARVSTTNLGSVSGALRLTGLPFAANSTTNSDSAVHVGYATGFSITAGQSVSGYVPASVAYLKFRIWSSTVGTVDMVDTEWTADGFVMLSGYYYI